MTTIKLLFLTTFLSLSALITADDNLIDYPDVADNPSYGLVTKLSFIEAHKKVPYGEDPNQFGLLWSAETNPKDVLVVFLHGGCWLSAYDIVHTYPSTTAIFQSGYDVWSLEYRRTGETDGGWPTTYDDIKAGLQHIAKLSDDGHTPKQIIIAGHSAGGHLAVLAGRDAKEIFASDVFGDDLKVDIIGLAAITNIATYSAGENGCQRAGVAFMGAPASEKPEAYASANPAKSTIATPITLLHGEADPIVPLTQMTEFSQPNVAKVTQPKAGHFDWVHPGTPAFTNFLSVLNKLTQP